MSKLKSILVAQAFNPTNTARYAYDSEGYMTVSVQPNPNNDMTEPEPPTRSFIMGSMYKTLEDFGTNPMILVLERVYEEEPKDI